MRQYLLPKEGKFYKADLHSHSTISDGKATPKEMKEYYKSKGYSVLALTDHEYLVEHSDLDEKDFVMITGYEYCICEYGEEVFTDIQAWWHTKTIELNIYPRDQKNETHVCFNPKYVNHGDKSRIQTVKYRGELAEREFSVEGIQRVIDEALANDCIVAINHPRYSMIRPEFYGQLKGWKLFEIINQKEFDANDEHNIHEYDELLQMGHKVFLTASDDNHKAFVYDSKTDVRPWPFTMIKAEELTHKAIFDAIENGNMYASQGPEIYDLYIEDGVAHISCSDAKFIGMKTNFRPKGMKSAPEGEYINDAEFKIVEGTEYVRFTVVDEYGRRAYTRAYFI